MSGLVSKTVIEEIRSRTDIVDVIRSRGINLQRSGSSFLACCPFHQEKTPSFNVNQARQMFKCFGCGEGGDVFSFVMKHDGMTFGDTIRMLGERCGVEVTTERDSGMAAIRRRLLKIHDELCDHYHESLLTLPEAGRAREYLNARKLSIEVIRQFRIGYAPAARDALQSFARTRKFTDREMVEAGLMTVSERYGRGDLYDRFRGRLMFPIQDTQGRVVAFSGRLLEKNARAAKYVNSPETPLFVKSRTLYALDKAQRHIVAAPDRQVLLCEGQIDTIRCHAAGFPTAVAAQGTACTEEHVSMLKRYADSAVLVFDSDPAGMKASVRAAGLFLAAGMPVRIARLPEGEDPDSLLANHGKEAFKGLLDNAEGVMEYQFKLMSGTERDPSSVGAASRISGGLIGTMAQCDNAVQRARMVQEAAELLNLPEAALASELEREMSRKAQRAAAREAYDESAQERRSHRREIPARRAETETRELPMHEDAQLEEEFYPEEYGASAPRPRILARPSPAEAGLCELLLHNIENNALVKFVETYVPAEIFKHEHCSRLVAAIYATCNSEADTLAELEERGEPELVEFVAEMVRAPDRSGYGEFTEQDAARDLILGVWRMHLEESRKAITETPPDTTGDPAEAARRRAALAMELRALRSWETGVQVISRKSKSVTEG